ncbi:MAG: hypothetical protein U9R11_00200 [Chloroflexota bacterium]|nr:hypothetical protein [Chloroflexota bacterium]
MAVFKSEARKLAATAQKMGAAVLHGSLQRLDKGGWALAGTELEKWLERYRGRSLFLIAIPIRESEGGVKTCSVCGRQYEGNECPHCREARQRLRGR